MKGTFILADGTTINSNSNQLIYTCGPYQEYSFEGIPYIFDCNGKSTISRGLTIIDFIIDEIDPEMYSHNEKDIQFIEHFIKGHHMKENELTIEIPDGKIVDWGESKNKIRLF